MPSVLTHYGFNKEVLDNKVEFLKGNEDIYLVGAQGPDPFFFYGIIPFFGGKKGKFVRKFGSGLHKVDPAEAFGFLLNYANEKNEKDILYSYILGAGLHYILDRKMHPYVYYKTGFSTDKKSKRKYHVDHTRFETNLDVLLVNDRYKSYKVRPVEAIKCNEDKIEYVSEMYEKLARSVFKEENIDDDSFEDAYEQMCTIEKMLYSKNGIKKGVVSFLFKGTPLNTMMHPLVVKDDVKIDYLNLNKNEWKDPTTETVYEKSVYDLIEEAKVEANEWINLVKEAYNGKPVNLKIFTKDFMYGGYKVGSKMKVFKSVYEKGEEN